MPVFKLDENILFPPPFLANEDGIVAFGGDLSVERLLAAYKNGIFPWYNEWDPILWWSPDPRFVLFPDDLHIPKSLKKSLKKNKFKITIDNDFDKVIEGCRKQRLNNTWIDNDMVKAYCELHKNGYAHSIEAWHEGQLAGGLYGVSLGKIFFGESMFSLVPDASKTAFVKLVMMLQNNGFMCIDSQVYTDHVKRFGGVNIPRKHYLQLLKKALSYETVKGNWSDIYRIE